MTQNMVTVRTRGSAGFDSPLPWSQINASPSPVSSSDMSCPPTRSNIDVAVAGTRGSKLGVNVNVTVDQQAKTSSSSRFALSERERERDASVGMASNPEVPTCDSATTSASGPLALVKASHNRIRAVPKKRKYEEVKVARSAEEQKKAVQSDSDDVSTPSTSYDCLQSERLLTGSPIRYMESVSSANMSSEDSDDLRETPKLVENRDNFDWQQVAKSLIPMLGFLNPRLECRQLEKFIGASGTTAFKSTHNSQPHDPIVDLSKRLIQTLESQLKSHRTSDYPDDNLFVQSFVATLCRTFVDLCDAKSNLATQATTTTSEKRLNADADSPNSPARKITRVETPAELVIADCGNEHDHKSRKDRFNQQSLSLERMASTRSTGRAASDQIMPSDTRTDAVQRVFAGQAEPLHNLVQVNSEQTHAQICVPEAIYPHQTLRSNDHQKTRFAKYSPSRTGHWCATHVTVANYLKNCQLESNIGSKLPAGLSGKKSISELFEGALKDALKVTPREKSFRANCNVSEEAGPHGGRATYTSAEDCLLSLPLPIPIPLSFMRRIENNSAHRVGSHSDLRDKQKLPENCVMRDTSLSKAGGNRRQEDAHPGWLAQSARFNEASKSTVHQSDDPRRQGCNNYCTCYRESSQNSGYNQDSNPTDDRQSHRSQPTACANGQTLAAPETGSSFRTPANVSSVNRNMTSTLSLRYSATEYHRQSQNQPNSGSMNQHMIRTMDPRQPAQEACGPAHYYPSNVNVMQQASGMVHEQRQSHVNASSERTVMPDSRYMAYNNNTSQSLMHLQARLAARTTADHFALGGPLNLAQNNQQATQAVTRLFQNRPWADLHAPHPLIPTNSHNPLNAPHNTVKPYMV